MTLHNRNKEIRRVRVQDIIENPANFRTHDDLQRGALQAVVGEIGWFGYPDVFEHPDHPGQVMLVDGELRKQHLLEHYGPDAAIDVNVCDFTPAEAEKALATKDPLAAMAQSDATKRAELLREMEADSESFAELIAELARRERINLDPLPDDIWQEHEIPAPGNEMTGRWDARPGKLWVAQGRATHRIFVGDPDNAEHLAELLDGAEPFLMIAKPPAGITGNVYRLFTGPVAYLFYGPSTCVELVGHLHAHGFEVRTQLIWRHEIDEDEPRQEYHAHHSACFYAVRKGQSTLWNGSRTESTVWDAPVPGFGALPIHVVGRPMVNHGTAEHPVFDAYGGQSVGSVAVAAERLGRPSYTMVTPDWADYGAVICERLQQEGATVQ